MSQTWYELRIAGSPGTAAGEGGGDAGISISEAGRLCTISSGQAKRFASADDAHDYLVRQTIPGRYRFEAVLCTAASAGAASRAA